MAPNDFGGGQVVAAVNGQTVEQAILGDGTHCLRFTWDAAGKRAWLQIHKNWKRGAPFASDVSLFLSDITAAFGDDAHLFVGGADGVTFADFSVRKIGENELGTFPRSDAFHNDPSAHTWLPI
jgi:hypothetical protein